MNAALMSYEDDYQPSISSHHSLRETRPWLRGLMAHFAEPRFVPALRNLTPPRDYALFWRATLSAAGLYAQLGATVPTRGFHLAYSPGFRDSVRGQSRPRLALGPAGLP